jgi:membrane protein
MLFKRRLLRWGLFLRRLQREMGYDDCMGMAAQIAFFATLSLFPFFIFLLSLVSSLPVGEGLVDNTLGSLQAQLPPESYELIRDYVENRLDNILESPSQKLVSIGLLTALWSASMAVGALITTINRAYNLRPRRSIVQQKILSIALTLVLTAIWLLAMWLVLFGPTATHALFQALSLAGDTHNIWTHLRLWIASGLTLLSLAILYYYAPEARQRFRWILPGAVTSTILWLGASSLFRLFVRNFATYNKLYGSLTAVIILMVWLWISGLIFLLGAEINALMKRMEHETGHYKVRPLR